MDMEDVLYLGFFLLIMVGIVSGVVLAVAYLDYKLHEYPITITQNGAVIYKGIKSCVEIASSGDTTTIYIRKGFLCLFPKSTLVSKNIEVMTNG